jgi:hypothetical protein
VGEVSLIAVQPLPDRIGETSDLQKIVGLEEPQPILKREPFARVNLLSDLP